MMLKELSVNLAEELINHGPGPASVCTLLSEISGPCCTKNGQLYPADKPLSSG